MGSVSDLRDTALGDAQNTRGVPLQEQNQAADLSSGTPNYVATGGFGGVGYAAWSPDGGVPQAAFVQYAAMPPAGFWPQAPTVPADSSATYYGESGVYPMGGQQQAAFVQGGLCRISGRCSSVGGPLRT